jgi:quercetin dioxygenase-like cupin family protein
MSTAIIVGADQNDALQDQVLAQLFTGQDLPLRIDLSLTELETALPALLQQYNRPVLVGIGRAATAVWALAGQLDTIGATLLIHPQDLPDFAGHRLLQPCLLVHAADTTLTNPALLKTLQRPRPDIAQIIHDQPATLAPLYQRFIRQFSGASPDSLARIIHCAEIAKGFPAPAPGAQPIFEDENCLVGAVQLDQHEPYEHINYRDELHVVIRGTGHFRHGDGELVEVRQGDLAYVKAFEKHRWSDWSPDFKLLFIQTGPSPV